MFRDPACSVPPGGSTSRCPASSVIACGTLPLLPNFVCVVSFRVCRVSDGTDKQMDRRTDGGCAAFFRCGLSTRLLCPVVQKKRHRAPRWPPSDWSVDHTAWELTGSETCKKSTRNTDICSSRLGADSCSHHLQVRGIKNKKKPLLDL